MVDSHPVVVVGAGLVGSMAGLMLAQRGYQVKIFELRPDYRMANTATNEKGGLHGQLTNVTKRSINLALSHRGLCALRAVGLEELVLKNSVPMEGRMIHPPHEVDITKTVFQPYEHKPGHAIYSISREELNSVLLDAIEKLDNIEVRFESRFEGIDRTTGDALITPAGGARAAVPAQFVVGADGAFSRAREELGRLVRLDFTREYIKHGYKELCIPPKANGDFAMPPHALHIWPRHEFMMIGLPNADKSFTCTLFMPFEDLDKIQTPGDVITFFRNWFPDVAGDDFKLMPTLVEDFFRNPTSSLLSVKCDPWHYKGKLLLLGDAAHATVPFYGQGMNAGFEDCLRFDEMLAEAAAAAGSAAGGGGKIPPGEAIEGLFGRFTAEMVPSRRGLVEVSLDNYIEMRSKTASTLFVLKKKVEAILELWLPASVYEWQPLYTMVTFTRTPYHIAILRARRQDTFLYSMMGAAAAGAAAAAFAILARRGRA